MLYKFVKETNQENSGFFFFAYLEYFTEIYGYWNKTNTFLGENYVNNKH